MRLLVLALSTLLISQAAQAAERGFRNYDGDTFRATFRIANIDTPEIKRKCDYERMLAIKAREFTERFLKQGKTVIKQTGVDRYGRILATVERGGVDLGKALVKEGLARPWRGRRENWCN